MNEKLKIKNEFLRLVPVSLLFGFVVINYYSIFGIGYKTIGDVVAGNFDAQTLIVLFFLNVVFRGALC